MVHDESLHGKIREVLVEMGLIVNPLATFDHDLEKVVINCRGRCSKEIFLFLFRKGPSMYTDIRRGVGYSDVAVSDSLARMVGGGMLTKRAAAQGSHLVYDISLRSITWLRDRRTKPLLMLATV
jgi:hypothetical protein